MSKLIAALVAGAFTMVPMGYAAAADAAPDCKAIEAKVAECKKGDGKSADCMKAVKDAKGCKKDDAKPAAAAPKKEKKGGC